MSTTRQDDLFKKAMESEMEAKIEISGSALDTAIEFIGSNFNPEDVFSERDLDDWAARNKYIKE